MQNALMLNAGIPFVVWGVVIKARIGWPKVPRGIPLIGVIPAPSIDAVPELAGIERFARRLDGAQQRGVGRDGQFWHGLTDDGP